MVRSLKIRAICKKKQKPISAFEEKTKTDHFVQIFGFKVELLRTILTSPVEITLITHTSHTYHPRRASHSLCAG